MNHRTRRQLKHYVVKSIVPREEDPFRLGPPEPQTQLPADIGDRARAIHDHEYRREFVIHQAWQMHLTGVPHDLIAQRFQVTVKTARRWLKEARSLFAQRADHLAPRDIVGETMELYDGLQAQALQILHTSKSEHYRLRAIEQAGRLQFDKVKIIETTGFFDHAKMVPDTASRVDPAAAEADEIRAFARAVLAGDEKFFEAEAVEVVDEEEPGGASG